MRGRHRDPGLGRRARIAVVALVVLAAVGGLAVWRSRNPGGCKGTVRLAVAAAPEIATVLAKTSAAWAETARGDGGECVAVDVRAAAAADVAVDVATHSNVTVPGLTAKSSAAPSPSAGPSASAAAGEAPTPDVWVPDSSIWLSRVRLAAPALVPLEAASVAASPVVLAVPEPIATGLGWPTKSQNWNTILGLMTSGLPLNIGVVEPNRDAAGLTSLIALASAAETMGENSGPIRVQVARALISGRVPAEADLLSKFPKSEADVATSLVAAPLAERSLIAYNATAPGVKLAALYVQPLPPALDYPWAVMPGADATKAQLAEELRQALTGDQYIADLATVGLRGPDGTAGFPAMPGAPVTLRTSPPDGAVVSEAIGTWLSLTRPGRILAVVDVSGSMSVREPSANYTPRYQILIQAARQGLSLFDDAWQVGLWTFSTNLDGPLDYRKWLPIKPLTENRGPLEQAMNEIRPVPGGDTGLYDTALAAYKTVQEGWDPNAVNSVILMTDGANDDDNGISLDQLLSSLQALVDPRYPVQIIIIGIGDEVSEPELKAITDVTSGGVYIARDPSDINEIFLKALSTRPPSTS